jgi:hypothetical protein
MKLRLTEGLEPRSLFLPIGESGSGKTRALVDAVSVLGGVRGTDLSLGIELFRGKNQAFPSSIKHLSIY